MAIVSTGAGLLNPLVNLWVSFVNIFPGIIAAIVILIVGYLIAFILGHAVKIVLQKVGLDKQVAKAQLTKAVGKLNISSVIGEITKWYIFVLFLQGAAEVLSLGTLSQWITAFAFWLPNVIAAVIIVIFGLIFAHFVTMKIEEHSKMTGAKFASGVIKIVITFIVIVMALDQIGIDVTILEQGFLIILAGIALAVGLAFGLGSKKEVENAMKDIKKYF